MRIMNARRVVAAITALGVLAGCASQANREALQRLQRDCAGGDQSSCAQEPYQEAINHDEAISNGVEAAAIVVLLPLIVLGAAAAAQANNQPSVQPWSATCTRLGNVTNCSGF